MAFGSSTVSAFGGAVSDILGGQSQARGLRLKAQGNEVEAENYDSASTLALQNAEFTRESTAVRLMQQQREAELGIGATRSDIAGAGFANSGSALDIMRSGVQQAALTQQILGRQGLITEAGYNEQAQSYTKLAGYARYAANEENSMADDAERNSLITAGIKGATAIASLFTGGIGPGTFSGNDMFGFSEDPESLAQSSRGGGFGGGAF